MADTFFATGSAGKASDAKGSWSVALDISDELEADAGTMSFDVPAEGSVSPSITGVMSSADVLLIKSPGRVNVSFTYSGVSPAPTVTNLPVREHLLLQTTGLTALTIANPSTAAIRVTVAIAKLAT